jgi:hypothetical protein
MFSQDEIKARPEKVFSMISDYAFAETEFPTPSPSRINHLIRYAQTCDQRGHSRASWNCMVHSPLLDMALYDLPYSIGFLNWFVTSSVALFTLSPQSQN